VCSHSAMLDHGLLAVSGGGRLLGSHISALSDRYRL
jgi:hypothetical protein